MLPLRIGSFTPAAPVVLAVAAAITLPTIQYGALSSGGDDTVQQMARLVIQHRTGSEPVAVYGVFVRNLVFYSGVKTTDQPRSAARFST